MDSKEAVAALEQAAGALLASAKDHKRASSYHRRAAQRDMERSRRTTAAFWKAQASGDTQGGSHG